MKQELQSSKIQESAMEAASDWQKARSKWMSAAERAESEFNKIMNLKSDKIDRDVGQYEFAKYDAQKAWEKLQEARNVWQEARKVWIESDADW
jgi:hypothetical protein